MPNSILSKNKVPIRLPDARWQHISEEHPELADLYANILQTVAEPQRVLSGSSGELLAVREIERGKWLVVVYRESTDDGFIITAFLTRRARRLRKRKQVWP